MLYGGELLNTLMVPMVVSTPTLLLDIGMELGAIFLKQLTILGVSILRLRDRLALKSLTALMFCYGKILGLMEVLGLKTFILGYFLSTLVKISLSPTNEV